MSGIDKKACRQFLEPGLAPNSDCGLFLVPKLKYIIRTAVKIVGHRRLLILCLYARGNTPGDRPRLAYTIFQASDSFITYDHQPDTKTVWRTAMLENLEQEYRFLIEKCAFYSRPDEVRVINFCKPHVAVQLCGTGFSAISHMQQQLRDKETLQRQKGREQKIRSRLSGLNPLPCDLEEWLRRKVLPAYFFYDYRKGKKAIRGLCSACGQEIELTGVRHNAAGVCPHCDRELTMKANKKRGYIWDRVTATVVQRFHGNSLIIRIVKAYHDFPKNGPVEMNCYEETRIIIDPQKNGALGEEVYHNSGDSVGITRWKKGYPPVSYLFQRNFNVETCGFLYCKNLSRALKGTPWQYCQLREFYEGVHDQMEVGPYLISYRKIPSIEFFVKLKLFWLVTHVVYRNDGEKDINLNGKNLREVLQIDPSDLPRLQKPEADIHILRLLRILRAAGHQPSEEFFTWVNANELTEMNQLALALNNTTPHKLMRYLDQLFSKLKKITYRGCAGVLSDYSDYLGFCEQLQYDLKNEFVLFPKNFKRAHDQANDLIKQHRVEQYDPQIAAMQKELKDRYQFKADGLIVLPPHSAREIVVEGQKLRHCVGGYAQSMAEKRTVILFIRQEAKRNKPFFTVEVQGDKIRQVRGSNNRAPIPEVTAFLGKWKKKKHLDDAA